MDGSHVGLPLGFGGNAARSRRLDRQDCPRTVADELHVAAAARPAHQRQLGLGEQLEQHRHRARQADLDHPAGHRADLGDRREVEPERGTAQPADRFAERRARAFGGQLATVGPRAVAQPENEAAPVVGDDPAVGERRNHLALGVERDEAGIGRRAQVLRPSGQADTLGEELLRRVDEGDFDRPVVAAAAGQRERRQDSCEEPAPRHGPALDHRRPGLNPPRRLVMMGAAPAAPRPVRSCADGSARPATAARPGGCA
jgi:hypothetical protein